MLGKQTLNLSTLNLGSRRSNDLPLRLLALKLNENEIYRVDSIKFLGVPIDNKQHLRYEENKVTKGVGLLYKVKPFLDKTSLTSNLLLLHALLSQLWKPCMGWYK